MMLTQMDGEMRAMGLQCVRAMLVMACMAAVLTGCATGNATHAGRGEASQRANSKQGDSPGETAIPDPNVKTLYAMARILTVQGKEDQSEIVLQRLIAEYPNFVPAYSDLAKLYLASNRLEQAKLMLDRGLDISPGDPVLLNNAGLFHLSDGDYEGALTYFTAAVERMPRESQYRGNLALALAMSGDYSESLRVYRQILPENLAQKNIELVRTSHAYRRPAPLRDALPVPEEPAPVTETPAEPYAESKAPAEHSEAIATPDVSIERRMTLPMATVEPVVPSRAPEPAGDVSAESAIVDAEPEKTIPQAPPGFRGMMW